jgi:hypothetical protein
MGEPVYKKLPETKFGGLQERNILITSRRYLFATIHNYVTSKTEWTVARVIDLSGVFVGHRLPR